VRNQVGSPDANDGDKDEATKVHNSKR
jgi:hypothetical protein